MKICVLQRRFMMQFCVSDSASHIDVTDKLTEPYKKDFVVPDIWEKKGDFISTDRAYEIGDEVDLASIYDLIVEGAGLVGWRDHEWREHAVYEMGTEIGTQWGRQHRVYGFGKIVMESKLGQQVIIY